MHVHMYPKEISKFQVCYPDGQDRYNITCKHIDKWTARLIDGQTGGETEKW